MYSIEPVVLAFLVFYAMLLLPIYRTLQVIGSVEEEAPEGPIWPIPRMTYPFLKPYDIGFYKFARNVAKMTGLHQILSGNY